MPQSSLRTLSRKILNRDITVESLVSGALGRARASDSVFTAIDDRVLEEARLADQRLDRGRTGPALSGIPITLKDLFDIRGESTLAGSVVLKRHARPAKSDCEVLKPLRKAGFLFLGRTNMSEFAFSGLGLNPHYGNPRSIWDMSSARLAGGSSSGSAVSVAEGIVPVSMGTDTAGSCRIPAAFNAVVGVKPSYGRFSLQGVYPLSHSSDAPGPIGIDVDSCFIVDRLISGEWDGHGDIPVLQPANIGGLRLMVPESVVLEDLDPEVDACFERAVAGLADAGATVERRPAPVIDECVDLFMNRAIAGYEAYRLHRNMMEDHGDEYDPNVYSRILAYKDITRDEQEARYAAKLALKRSFADAMHRDTFDAMICPTVACVPPRISDAQVETNTRRINLKCLRNTVTANNFDGCSLTVPCHDAGSAPVGLMVSSVHGDDRRLYEIGAAVESTLNRIRVR